MSGVCVRWADLDMSSRRRRRHSIDCERPTLCLGEHGSRKPVYQTCARRGARRWYRMR